MTDDLDPRDAEPTSSTPDGTAPVAPAPSGEQPAPQSPPPPPPPPAYAPPAPPAAPAYAAPAPPAAPAYAAPAPAAAGVAPVPARKSRTGLIVGLSIAAVLLLCGLVSCAALVLFSGNGDTAQIKQAETHYNAAESAIVTATADIKAAKGAGDTAARLASAGNALRTARDELASSRAAIEQVHASAGRTKYLASLASATLAVGGLENVLAYAGTANDLGGIATEAGSAASTARSHLDGAVSAGNARNYTKMRSEAEAASAGFVRAATLFREADKLDTTAGLSKAAAYADTRNRQAVFMIGMADEGASGKASAYNHDIKRVKALDAQAAKIGEPAIVTDPNWAQDRLSALTDKATAAGDTADKLRAEALKSLGYTG